jgi:hypothetical protein
LLRRFAGCGDGFGAEPIGVVIIPTISIGVGYGMNPQADELVTLLKQDSDVKERLLIKTKIV